MELIVIKLKFDKIKQRTLVIDILNNWERQQLRKLPNSISIPFLELVSKPENYIKDTSQLVITYCNYGNHSGQAVKILRKRSYLNSFVLEGGAEGYFSKN